MHNKLQKPKAYQEKRCMFLKQSFFVDERVHIPRKDTEPLVSIALNEIKKAGKRIVCADIGTGAGVIAINLVLQSKLVEKVYATDISEDALKVARKNILNYAVQKKIKLKRGNLLQPVRNIKLDIIIANLPHASKEIFREKPYLNLEPKEGTYGGETGLETIESFLKELSFYKYLNSTIAIILKILPEQSKKTELIAQKYLPAKKVFTEKDDTGKSNYLIIK